VSGKQENRPGGWTKGPDMASSRGGGESNGSGGGDRRGGPGGKPTSSTRLHGLGGKKEKGKAETAAKMQKAGGRVGLVGFGGGGGRG